MRRTQTTIQVGKQRPGNISFQNMTKPLEKKKNELQRWQKI